jgi:hypothetical protein
MGNPRSTDDPVSPTDDRMDERYESAGSFVPRLALGVVIEFVWPPSRSPVCVGFDRSLLTQRSVFVDRLLAFKGALRF